MLAARPFIEKGSQHSRLEELIAALEAGKHVVLEFGRQAKLLDYLLVSNVITRRLHEVWVKKTEQYLNTKNESDKPRQLMITIEEAHKFLNSEAASQTSFGTIARELRKFFVTLLVVDQRPSGIDSEVLSQIGTRMVGVWARNGCFGCLVSMTNDVPTGCSPRNSSIMCCWTRRINCSPKKSVIAPSTPPSIKPKELAGLTMQSNSGTRSK